MGYFYNNLIRLCSERKVSPSGVAHSIGLSNAAASGWKKGKNPSDTTLQKIANYFGVSVGYLLGNENEKTPTDGERTITDDDIKFALFGGDGEITDAMYQEVRNFADYIKQREADKKKE